MFNLINFIRVEKDFFGFSYIKVKTSRKRGGRLSHKNSSLLSDWTVNLIDKTYKLIERQIIITQVVINWFNWLINLVISELGFWFRIFFSLEPWSWTLNIYSTTLMNGHLNYWTFIIFSSKLDISYWGSTWGQTENASRFN